MGVKFGLVPRRKGLRSWLRHGATSRKVAGLITDGDIGIFYSFKPSIHSRALGSTEALTEMGTRGVKTASA
jgi:hypothetical protein